MDMSLALWRTKQTVLPTFVPSDIFPITKLPTQLSLSGR